MSKSVYFGNAQRPPPSPLSLMPAQQGPNDESLNASPELQLYLLRQRVNVLHNQVQALTNVIAELTNEVRTLRQELNFYEVSAKRPRSSGR